MAKNRPPSYTPAPELPSDPELRRRFGEIVAVLAQTQTVSGAARTLGLSRNHFQTILHRVIAAMLEEITPKPAGRPAKPEQMAALEAENERLKGELEALTIRSEVIERMMSVVGEIASGKASLPRSRSKKTKPEDPEPAPILRTVVATMRDARLRTKDCAGLLRISPSTVRRHARPSAPRARKPDRSIDDNARCLVRQIVRKTHGLIGAAALGKASGLPRRTCAVIKRRELCEMEYERRARAAAVVVAEPGVVRGFDAMHVEATEGKAYWLVAADAAVPFRTSILTVPTYDANHVIAALAEDFERHGPPLVLRLDRIACQRTPEVEQLLAHYDVLPLHGPPRYPRYYGQLERQNREHRDWYTLLGIVPMRVLATAGNEMRESLNTLWPRPTLGGCTAQQLWQRRKALDVNRRELRVDVERRAAGLVRSGSQLLHARRIAIETSLTERGLLTINQGRWC